MGVAAAGTGGGVAWRLATLSHLSAVVKWKIQQEVTLQRCRTALQELVYLQQQINYVKVEMKPMLLICQPM